MPTASNTMVALHVCKASRDSTIKAMLELPQQAGTVLDQPELWRLHGEGNANWVFAYTGSLPHLAGQVLRVRKPKAAWSPEQQALEEAVWGPVLGMPPAVCSAAREQAYVQLMLAPLLGPQHVLQQQPVHLDPVFLRRLLHNSGCLESDRTARGSGEADLAVGPAALMPDLTVMGCSNTPASAAGSGPSEKTASPVVCVELKPKCGFIGGFCATIHPSNQAIKRGSSRYRLHQLLKLAQGKIACRSSYDPCVLFSGDPRAALLALLEHPQNNLRVFVNGKPQQIARETSALDLRPGQQQQQPGEQPGGSVQQLLAGWLHSTAEDWRPAMAELLAAVLAQEGVLPRLLQAQQQCQYDVEGIFGLYCHLTGGVQPVPDLPSSGGGAACKQGELARQAAAIAQLLALPKEEQFAVLRSYVVATTAKDCAVMITLQRLDDESGQPDMCRPPSGSRSNLQLVQEAKQGGQANPGQQSQQQQQHHQQQQCQQQHQRQQQRAPAAPPIRHVYCPAVGTTFAYRLCFVDLDLKPLAKIPLHHELDAAIMAAAQRHLTGERPRLITLG